MVYSRGNKFVAIQYLPLTNCKRPELYIGEGNQLLKVASFGSERKAELFEEFLQELMKPLLVDEGGDAYAGKAR